MSEKWDIRFLELAAHMADQWSKDRSSKVGCLIVGPDKEIRSVGYNGFPRGVNDDVEERHARPIKYDYTEHAERNAVYNAARVGTPLAGCIAYVPWFPCTDCARALIQSGIKTVVGYTPDFNDPQWGPKFKISKIMLHEAGITTVLYNRQPKRSQ